MGPPAAAKWLEQLAGAWGDSQDHTPPGFPPYNSLQPFPTIGSDLIAPLLQPWAAARKEETNFEIEDGGGICRPDGLLRGHQNRGFQMVASTNQITMIGSSLLNRGLRRIYLKRGHLKTPPLTSFGDSVAYWDGDALVVDAIGFDDKSFMDLDGSRHSTEMHIVERWRFVADGKWLERRWTVDDPRALKAPFTFLRYHERAPVDTRPAERVCLDEPETWRAWVYIRNTGVQTLDEKRAEAAKAASQKKN